MYGDVCGGDFVVEFVCVGERVDFGDGVGCVVEGEDGEDGEDGEEGVIGVDERCGVGERRAGRREVWR